MSPPADLKKSPPKPPPPQTPADWSLPLETRIARAIKSADKTYFFENYSKQARSVLRDLEKAGFRIVPIEPTVDMVEAAKDNLLYGVGKASELCRATWINMVKATPKI